MNNGKTGPTGPVEPVLEMDDIQGVVVPGFFKPHQTLLGLRIPEGLKAIRRFKSLLKKLADEISPGSKTLADRRAFRASGRKRTDEEGEVLLGIGFSFSCLLRLTPEASLVPSEAFQTGLVKRSALLGDSTDPKNEGNPENWVVGKPGSELDVLVVISGDHRQAVTVRADQLAAEFEAECLKILYCEDGDVLGGKLRGHEHFGFADGISQPGIRGRASDTCNDFITERHIASTQIPETWLYGYPGQDLVWPGEFVIGYPKTSPDPLLPGPADLLLPEWTKNGSFLVFRRLRQDVCLFWQTMRENAETLAKLPGFTNMGDVRLASLLTGRWPSGAPMNRTPAADLPGLGAEPLANNNFIFDSDTPMLPLTHGRQDPYPQLQAKADPVGTNTCPWAAHIRKLNIRDSASDQGGRESTFNRRLLRVGIPFGKSLHDLDHNCDKSLDDLLKDLYDKCAKIEQHDKKGNSEHGYGELRDSENADRQNCHPERGERGLLFLSIQASIDQQFEFLMSRWVNDAVRPKMPGGNDFLIGQNAGAENGIRRCVLFGSELQQAPFMATKQWVIPTGGGYFFIPSINALRKVIARY